jgi:hypothetical protein
MSHVRQQIRDAAELLLVGLPSTGNRVYSGRDLAAQPLQATELPALVIEVADERAQQQGFAAAGAAPVMCEAVLRVHVIVKSSAGAIDTADTACAEVFSAVGSNVRFGGATVAGYLGTEGPRIDASTDRPVVRASIEYMMRYVIAHNDATVAL